jgi:DmsE family decaheme c-type cytochrome
VSCLSCHNPHPKGAAPKSLLIKPEFELCTTCHLQKKAALMRSSHMPMREGKMTCTSCHNPHGTPYPKQLLQVSVNQNCYTCHAEKRGPFLWEHPPVRENCLNCHDAHGTVNDYLLKAKQPVLCIQCHNGFASGGMGNAHAARDRYTLNQSCLNCHPMIHGSTHPQGNRFKR